MPNPEHTHEMATEGVALNLNIHQQDCECGMYRLVNYTVKPTHYSPWMGEFKDVANPSPSTIEAPVVGVSDRLKELEELVQYAVVEGYWECPEGCNDPDPDPDNGELCSECLDKGIESKRTAVGAGHQALLKYLEANVWNR